MAGIENRFLDPKNYVNRELSWLEFDYRVLGEAKDKSNPLFDRMSIYIVSVQTALSHSGALTVITFQIGLYYFSFRSRCSQLLKGRIFYKKPAFNFKTISHFRFFLHYC